MLKVGILSDTHCTLVPQLFNFFKDVDELWHAGDLGNIETAETLAQFKPLRAVHGNIDDHIVRLQYPEDLFFHVEDVNVYMTHIGGYPGHHIPEVKYILEEKKPDLNIRQETGFAPRQSRSSRQFRISQANHLHPNGHRRENLQGHGNLPA